MTIRRTLLSAFLLVGLVPAMLLTYLAFVKARSALQEEIQRSLVIEAHSVATDVDKIMFERLQNAVIWSRLDVMQDMQVNDIDKRLSSFLAELQDGYRGVYRSLSCIDPTGRTVSSSQRAPAADSEPQAPPWLETSVSGSRVAIGQPETSGEQASLSLETSIASRFSASPLGRLRLQIDWTQIYGLLDHAFGNGRMVAILDRDGRLIAASQRLRQQGLLLGNALADWPAPVATAGMVIRDGGPVHPSAVMVATGISHGYAAFEGLGWKTLIIQPVDEALAPVHRMGTIFLALLGIAALAIIVVATSVSQRIARPIVALTGFARRYMRDKTLAAPPPAAPGEVGELTDTFVRMMRDIEQSRQNLVRASKLAVVGEMSSIIAHEVRTPLGILRSSAQMLRREPGISEEGRELTDFIESETERLNRLVSAMLDSTRPRPPTFAATDMHELIRKSATMLTAQADKGQVRIATRLEARDPQIECDAEQMTQVLLNLILNGLQILAGGGHMEIATQDDGERLRIDIADDGPGIAPEERTRIFEAFFFRREGGLGLGLAVVQQIVVAHGGQIEATASALGGALFSIWIPRKAHSES